MSYNPTGAKPNSLDVFSGLITEQSPTNVPKGCSPFCQDVSFLPGSVGGRDGFQRVFQTPFPAAAGVIPTITYAKSYIDPQGIIRNLYLDSNGVLWVENRSTAPGIKAQIYQTTPGSYAKSITAFGREYIAISDGLNGTDIALQYDGTNLDRVTQDGPGASPSVASIALPASAMVGSAAPPVLIVTEADPSGVAGDGSFTTINFWTPSSTSAFNEGNIITIAGNTSADMNVTATIISIIVGSTPGPFKNLITLQYSNPSTAVFGTGGTATATSGVTMTRANNIVTVSTATPHGLQVGYRSQITDVPAATVGTGIVSITINNADAPGRATIETTDPNGMVPGLFVSLSGIAGATVATISSVSRQGNVVTVVTAAAHNLTPGAGIQLSGVATGTFNTVTTVSQIVSATSFTYLQTDADATSTGGSVALLWPFPVTPTPTYFEVLSAPSPTTFQIALNYSDGVWASGLVKYAWDGTFFVSAVPSITSFQYRQYGPDATTISVGNVTPYGQIAPGEKQMRISYLTRQGFVTAPSPPVKFIANGGQYLSVSNIPIGPANVVARILQFTGARGSTFFYIPSPALAGGQVVATATQINDNTTTQIILDFSDNTLFSSIATSIPGNNLPAQIKLEGALGFGYFNSRLLTYGQRNIVLGLQNMGFEGGAFPTNPTLPTGWQAQAGGSLVPGHVGPGWMMTVLPGGSPYGQISQPFAFDAYGAPIALGDTLYRFRAWVQPSSLDPTLTLNIRFQAPSTSFAILLTIPSTAMSLAGGYIEFTMPAKTPLQIPPDTLLEIWGQSTFNNGTILVDEMNLIYDDVPYNDTVLIGSYVNNPEAFDGVSGVFGPQEDTRKVMDFGIVRQSLYLLTRDPSGRLHSVSANGVTEPVGWQVDQVAANCGLMSAFGLTKSQADDGSAAGGEEWLAWISESGVRIFGGDQPWKISQEIQPNWDASNQAAMRTAWALNDPVARIIYFGLPGLSTTAPNLILPVNYRGLDSAAQIAAADPQTGRDRSRKWTIWNLPMNGAALMYLSPGLLSPVFFGGNGSYPGLLPGFGNVYTPAVGQMTDHDYGQIYPVYITFFFSMDESGTQITLAYLTAQLSGVGKISIVALVNGLEKFWGLSCSRTLTAEPNFDLEWTGGNAQGYRIAFRIESFPLDGSEDTDNTFQLQGLVADIRETARLKVRGSSR